MYRNSTLLSYHSIELARAFRSLDELASPWLRFLSSRPQRLRRVEIAPRCIKIRVAYIFEAASLAMRNLRDDTASFFSTERDSAHSIPDRTLAAPFRELHLAGICVLECDIFRKPRLSSTLALAPTSRIFFRPNIMCHEYFQSIPLCLQYYFSREFSSDISNSCVSFSFFSFSRQIISCQFKYYSTSTTPIN